MPTRKRGTGSGGAAGNAPSGSTGLGSAAVGNAPSGNAGLGSAAAGNTGSGSQATDTPTGIPVPTCEIRSSEFSAKLVTEIIDALVSANIRQTEAYNELVTKISKTLTDFIKETNSNTSGQADPAESSHDEYKGLII